jgi:hypothetical protein
MRKQIPLFVGTALAGLAIGCFAADATAEEKLPFNPRVLMKPFDAIVDVPLLKAADVKDEVRSNELVLGVVVNGKARAYPINQLTGPIREIINDELGGSAIAATW